MISKTVKKRSSVQRNLSDKKKKSAKRSSVQRNLKKKSYKKRLSGYERFVHQQMKKMETDPLYKNLTMQEKMNLIKKVWIAVR
jgi:hypothetical protein